MKLAAFAAFSTVAVVLCGCGGGSVSTSAPGFVRGDLTRAQWIGRADTFCSSTKNSIAPIRSKLGTALARGRLPLAGVYVRRVVYYLERDGDHLRSLGGPIERSKTIHRFEQRLERKIELNIDLAEALEAGEAAHAARIQTDLFRTGKVALGLAHRIGLQECGME